MRLYFQNDIKIARRAAVHAGVALLRIANACAVLDARRNVHVDCALLHHTRFSLALAARIRDHAPQTLARGTCAGNAEHGLLIAHLAASAACGTRRRPLAGSRSAAVTLFARFITADLHFSLFAE